MAGQNPGKIVGQLSGASVEQVSELVRVDDGVEGRPRGPVPSKAASLGELKDGAQQRLGRSGRRRCRHRVTRRAPRCGATADPTAANAVVLLLAAAPTMLWHGERQGQGVSLSGERSVAGRHAKKAWGVQLADVWMAKDVHAESALLLGSRSTEHCYIGVVGRNYFPSAWDALLKKVRTQPSSTPPTAACSRSARRRPSLLKPLESGARLQLTVDMSSGDHRPSSSTRGPEPRPLVAQRRGHPGRVRARGASARAASSA